MNRFFSALALSLSLATLSASALAAPPNKDAPARHQKADRKDKGNKDRKQFPMKGDEFKQHVAQRTEKARQRLEQHIQKKNIDADKARQIRAKFDAGVAKVNQKVEQVTSDGTVTKDEAKEVRQVVRNEVKTHRNGHKKNAKLVHVGTASPHALSVFALTVGGIPEPRAATSTSTATSTRTRTGTRTGTRTQRSEVHRADAAKGVAAPIATG